MKRHTCGVVEKLEFPFGRVFKNWPHGPLCKLTFVHIYLACPTQVILSLTLLVVCTLNPSELGREDILLSAVRGADGGQTGKSWPSGGKCQKARQCSSRPSPCMLPGPRPLFLREWEKQNGVRREAEGWFRTSHQKWQAGPLSFSRNSSPPPHTHYIYAHTVTHTFEEKRNYITHQLFLFTSPVEINPVSRDACGHVQGFLQAVRKKRRSLSQAQNTGPGRLRSVQRGWWAEGRGSLPKMLLPNASSWSLRLPM